MSLIHEIIQAEGVEPVDLQPLQILGNNQLINLAISLRGYLPDSSDPQWGIVHALAQVPAGVREAALSAQYAGNPPSGRHAYGRVTGEPALRQHCRAAVNMSDVVQLSRAFEEGTPYVGPIQFELSQTRRVNGGPDKRGITPCPEAVHQVRMFNNDREYLGRVGFNVHREGGAHVITIANIQGAPGRGPEYDRLRRQAGIDPFVATLSITQEVVTNAFPDAIFRSVIPPKARRPKF